MDVLLNAALRVVAKVEVVRDGESLMLCLLLLNVIFSLLHCHENLSQFLILLVFVREDAFALDTFSYFEVW